MISRKLPSSTADASTLGLGAKAKDPKKLMSF